MPLILEFEFQNGDKTTQYIPAEIWRYNDKKISKVFIFKDTLKNIVLDPHLETADVNYDNNSITVPPIFEKFELTKFPKPKPNPMQLQKRAEEIKEKDPAEGEQSSEPTDNN